MQSLRQRKLKLFDKIPSTKILKKKYSLRILVLLCFFTITPSLTGQVNIVPNGSFEDTVQCPTYISQIYNSVGWFSPTRNTPDYFNQCYNGFANAEPGVPINFWGTQYARTGEAYAGFAAYYSAPNGREYISTRLTNPLEANKKYCLAFYLSLSDSSRVGVTNIGAYFSQTNDTIYTDTITQGIFGSYLNYIPHFEFDSIILDTTNWVLISTNFIAQGGEEYLIIGVFKPDSLIQKDSIQNQGYYKTSYYYIDDVSLFECPDIPLDSTSTISIPNAFSPNGDGINDLFSPGTENLKSYNCTIFNRWGNQVFSSDEVSRSWDGKYNGCESPEGVYYYIIEANGLDGKQYRQSGFVMLMR
jgi:gliding motility-associated-like protein